MNKNRNQILLILFVFFVMSSCVLFSLGSGVKDITDSFTSDIPEYPSSQRIELKEEDLDQLIIDTWGSDYLQTDAVTFISWTEDMGIDVEVIYDEMLVNEKWRIESDWEWGFHYMESEWEKDSRRLSVLILYDLDSAVLGELYKYYGIDGVEPGGTLILNHVIDLSDQMDEMVDQLDKEDEIPLITISDIQYIETSSKNGDSSIWVFLPSGQIAQSDDHGETWSRVFDVPPEFEIEYVWPEEQLEFTKTENGLYFAYNPDYYPQLWYTESTDWDVIPLPEGASAVAAAPDGSGRVIASGANPKGVENAWILESPYGGWVPFTCEIDNWDPINDINWLPEYGIVGRNTQDAILHADANYSWEVMDRLNDYFTSGATFWIASDGSLYLDTNYESFFWTGERFEEYESNLQEPMGTIPGVASFGRGFVYIDSSRRYGYVRTEDGGQTVELLSIPDMPDRIETIDLAVSGDGMVYILNDAGLYLSRDGGSTWDLIVKN